MKQGAVPIRRDSPGMALAEVAAVALVYIAVSTSAARAIDLHWLFPSGWSPAERATGSGFLVGAIVQAGLVLAAAYLLRLTDLRQAIAAVAAPSTRQAWTIAIIATAIHIGTGILVFLPQPERVVELSQLNLWLSLIPALDGWSQEVLFRGYVLLRLARGGIAALPQILISGALFAAIHLGYAGEGGWAFAAPLIGTFMLGGFYAWAVRSGGGSLRPVVVCHVLIIIVLQPWLALVR